mmetsp:Transcript_53394/g.116562  ORF Transcript_53394/g.116562 Transcript_53394/m.116562 type:complete len:350 (+) Transcript_53394:700-1749(+)
MDLGTKRAPCRTLLELILCIQQAGGQRLVDLLEDFVEVLLRLFLLPCHGIFVAGHHLLELPLAGHRTHLVAHLGSQLQAWGEERQPAGNALAPLDLLEGHLVAEHEPDIRLHLQQGLQLGVQQRDPPSFSVGLAALQSALGFMPHSCQGGSPRQGLRQGRRCCGHNRQSAPTHLYPIASRSGKHAGIQVLFGGPPGIFLRISRASGEQVAQGNQRLAGLRQGDLLPVEEVAVQQELRLCFVPCFLISAVLFFPAARTMAATQLHVVDAASIAVGQKLKGLNDLLIECNSFCCFHGSRLSTQAQNQSVRVRFQCALPVCLAYLLCVRRSADFQDLIVVLWLRLLFLSGFV